MMNKVVHFEIPADDLTRAKKFYGSVFGWELEDTPMPGGMIYVMARTVPVDTNHMPKEPGAINGGLMQRGNGITSPVIAINVNSVDEYIKKVMTAGGKMLAPKMEIGGMGYYAYIQDTEGNTIGIWEELKKS